MSGLRSADLRHRRWWVAGLGVPMVLVCAGLMTAAGLGGGQAAAQGIGAPAIDVGLEPGDLPPGFREVAADELVVGAFSVRDTAESLAGAFSGSELEEFWVYGSADDSEVIEVLLVGPLTAAEQAAIDLQFAQREAMLEAIAGSFIMFVDLGDPQLLDTGNLGESALAYSTTLTLTSDLAQATNVLGYSWTENRVETALARRGEHLILVGVSRAGGGAPSAGAVDLAASVDRRLADYLGVGIGGFREADTLVPELTTHIPTPLDVSVDPAVVGANLLLVAVAMLVFVTAEELLRRTVAAQEGRLQRWLAPARWLARGQKRLDGFLVAHLGRGVADALRLGGIVLLYGVIFSFLEPGWNPFAVTGLFLLASLTVAAGLVGLAGDVSRWRVARRLGLPARLGVRPANLVLAVGSTTFSRLVTLVPGIMIGTPEAFEIDEGAADQQQRRRLLRVGAVTLVALGGGAWALTMLTGLLQRADLARGLVVFVGGLEALLLLVFAVAVQEMFVEMLGLEGSFGWALARRSRVLWFVALVLVGFIFWHTLINPRGDLAGALGETSVRAILITIGAFSVFSAAAWAADRFVRRGRQPAPGLGASEKVEPVSAAAPVADEAPAASGPAVAWAAAAATGAPARLVACPACGRQISSAARRCPGCGQVAGVLPAIVGAAVPAGPSSPQPTRAARSWLPAIAAGAVLVGLGVGAFALFGSGPAEPDDTTAASLTTTSSTTTTSTVPETTTTTVDPALAPAAAYFELLSRNDDAAAAEAAGMATGDAATFAQLIGLMDLGGLAVEAETPGDITVCYPTGPDGIVYCAHYTDFSLSGGRLAQFSVDGHALRTRIWEGEGPGWCHSYAGCNWDDPEADPGGLYMRSRYAYLTPTGSLLVAWQVHTGQRDLDVIMGGDGHHASFVTDSAGVDHGADWCASPIADPEPSSLGLRLARDQEGFLTCSFPEFGGPGAETAVTATLVLDWGGLHDNEYELPELSGE